MIISEPTLLCSFQGINAYQVKDSEERLLTATGPRPLSISFVPTPSSSKNASSVNISVELAQKFYLQFEVSPALEFPVFPTTRIYHKAPRSYLVPRLDPAQESGSFTRIEFPESAKEKETLEDINTFETILTQYSIILEPASDQIFVQAPMAPYNPSTYKSKEKSSPAHSGSDGKLFLIDETNGSVIGELGGGSKVVEDGHIRNNVADAVEITLPSNTSGKIRVTPASQSYLEMAKHPAYQNSTLVSGASTASQIIVNTSGYVCKALQSQADSFVQKSKPNAKPLTFEPTTHARIRKICNLTDGAASLSAKTVGQVQRYAQNFGASVANNDKIRAKRGIGPDGKLIENYKPGIFSKGMLAFSTVADGIDQAGRNFLSGTTTAATTVVNHKYGPEAGEITKNLGTGIRNVGLIYIDATGVTRKAVIKSVVKGMVVGKMPGGTNIIANGDGSYQLNNSSTSKQPPVRLSGGSLMNQKNDLNRSSTVTEKHVDNPPAYAQVKTGDYMK